MKHSRIDIQRRDFLRIGSLVVASAALASRAGRSPAQGAPHLDEKDPTAQALGYRHDATKVDKNKFTRYQAGQTCSNCQLFQGKAGDAWGPCAIYGGRQVAAKGWCNAYVKKAQG
jgi:hypothetical protein